MNHLITAILRLAVCCLGIFAISCKPNRASLLQGQSNTTLTFYGLAVDQDGKPLPGVRIEYRLEAYPEDWSFETRGRPYDVSFVSATSDEAGRFEFKVTGCMLKLTIARRQGYRHLYEVDLRDGTQNLFAIRLISWGSIMYRSDRNNPAIFVFVKDGVKVASALSSSGGSRAYGKQWIPNKPAWPQTPSLFDVDRKGDPPRVNAKIPIYIRVVDHNGDYLGGVTVALKVQRYRVMEDVLGGYRSLESIDPSRQNLRRLEVNTLSAVTNRRGKALIVVDGYAIQSAHASRPRFTQLKERTLDDDDPDEYACKLVDWGKTVYRSDEANPMTFVMVRAGATTTRAKPSRGGEDLVGDAWTAVQPAWPRYPTIENLVQIEPTTLPVPPNTTADDRG